MQERYLNRPTKRLKRSFEMLVFGQTGAPLILFPAADGRYDQYRDVGFLESAKNLIKGGVLQVYCPDGVDDLSWNNQSIHPAERVRIHNAYEQVILDEVFSLIERKSGRKRAAVGGCGFGAFHAANLAFRHPDRVSFVCCMGGIFDIKQFLDGHYDEDGYFHNPVDYLPNLEDPWYLERMRRMGIVLGTGEFDVCLDESRRLATTLQAKSIPLWLDVVPDAYHSWSCWKEAFPRYLERMLQLGGK
jgi:esterase/lipase superfamily enzyme